MHHSHTYTLHMQQDGLERELEFLQLFQQAQTQKVTPFKKYRSFWQCYLSEEGAWTRNVSIPHSKWNMNKPVCMQEMRTHLHDAKLANNECFSTETP